MARQTGFPLTWIVVLAIVLQQSVTTDAFTKNLQRRGASVPTSRSSSRPIVIFSSPPGGGDGFDRNSDPNPLSGNENSGAWSDTGKENNGAWSDTVEAFASFWEGDESNQNAPIVDNSTPAPQISKNEDTSYPIDLPSPILLGTSMVLAIVGVGSGFDIFSDTPRFPFIVNAVISAGGLALCVGLFYASILKAQAETEEDDRRYMSGR